MPEQGRRKQLQIFDGKARVLNKTSAVVLQHTQHVRTFHNPAELLMRSRIRLELIIHTLFACLLCLTHAALSMAGIRGRLKLLLDVRFIDLFAKGKVGFNQWADFPNSTIVFRSSTLP